MCWTGKSGRIDLSYVDQDTVEVTWSGDWQNNRQKAEVSVLKKEKDTDRVLEGAVFALSAKEDITNKERGCDPGSGNRDRGKGNRRGWKADL